MLPNYSSCVTFYIIRKLLPLIEFPLIPMLNDKITIWSEISRIQVCFQEIFHGKFSNEKFQLLIFPFFLNLKITSKFKKYPSFTIYFISKTILVKLYQKKHELH